MKILFCASEAFPFAKSGGLADVAHALPKALAQSDEVTLMLPLYRCMSFDRERLQKMAEKRLSFGGADYRVTLHTLQYAGMRVVFVESPPLSERDYLYGNPGSAYGDNDLRFALFSHAIAAFAKEERFDILHLNDWHTALAALFAKEAGVEAKILFTIHNLAYQGVFDVRRLPLLGIEERYFQMDGVEFYGKINFLKAGIAWCDALTTVSPTYAKEILTPEFGCGLEGFLRLHAGKLTGILNGIDTTLFDPRNDPMIACPMKRKISTFKKCNKKALSHAQNDLPLFVFIGRLTEQKGVDLLIALVEELASLPLRFYFLGEGDPQIGMWLEQMCETYENMAYYGGYDEAFAHRLYAAADFLVMPSRFEPCGLNQMIAMHYGTIPIVHTVGGLKDTVHATGYRCGLGLPYTPNEAEVLLEQIVQALVQWCEPETMERINRFNMACDFSIERTAREYRKLYVECIGK